MQQPLYDNVEGYEDDAQAIMQRVKVFVEHILMDYPERSALELLALVNNAASSAFCAVSIERRLA